MAIYTRFGIPPVFNAIAALVKRREGVLETYSKKICLLGDFAVGKTSLVRRFVHNRFDDQYISTLGVKVSRKTVVIPHHDAVIEMNLMVWDLAGGQQANPVAVSYLRGAAGALLVCDLTRAESLPSLDRYATALRQVMPGAQFVVAANKTDLFEQQQVTTHQIADAAAQLNAPYYLTSAKVGDAVDKAFRQLATLLLNQR